MLKKLFAAASVLSLLLCIISPKAFAFTDDADIQYQDAVSALTKAGIVQGYPDGSFQPQKNITRAEAAKLIAYFRLGAEAAEALSVPVQQSFNDVPNGHWASKYIAWDAGEGIISGMGNGKYAPEAPVTAIQMAKLLLAACGFSGTYEGPDWENNVSLDAGFVFSGDPEVIYSMPATREEVALYINNCMSYRAVEANDETAGEPTGSDSDEAIAYKAKFIEIRNNISSMIAGAENVTDSEGGIVLTTVINSADHLDDIHDALEWMYLSTFLNIVPDYASSLTGIADIDGINAYAAAVIANQSDLNSLLSKVTEVRLSGNGKSITVVSGDRGTIQFMPGKNGTAAEKAFDGFNNMLTNANQVILGDYEAAPMTYQMIITLCATMDDGSQCDINIPYTFCFAAA